MTVTLTIADDLASQLKPYEAELTEILKLGIREWRARSEAGYSGIRDVMERLAALPAPQEVLALRPATPLQERIDSLLEKNLAAGLSLEDQREWDLCQYAEHLVRLAKISAAKKLRDTTT
ncbi:MAG TPA: hypothetical protein VGM05_16675 [Planctomycetaceae bacterium]|jgi:hypothetical protein